MLICRFRVPAKETMTAHFASKRFQRNHAQQMAFNQPSSLRSSKSFAIAFRTTHEHSRYLLWPLGPDVRYQM
jgi:hypothetical protein